MKTYTDSARVITDTKELLAYNQGYVRACNMFLDWAKTNNIPRGSIEDEDISGLYTRIEYECGGAECMIEDLERQLKESKK